MGEMSSEITKKTPEQWVEHYQGAYLHNLTAESVSRIIKSDMTNVARQCVSIGFHLKAARDRELYKDAGYETLWEYAADQFGLSMSSASRYITINDRFSVGGNTPMLMEEYRNFSKSQLQEMISLSPEQAKKVTEKTTVKQIREMKPKKEKPKEVPAVVIDQEDTSNQCPGQMQVGDYPGVVPEESVATSQKRKCMYRPEKTCSLSPEEQKTKGDGTDCGHTCCWNCINHATCNMECSSSEGRPESEDEEQEAEEPVLENAIEYNRKILLDMIKNTENMLDQMQDYWIQKQPYTYAKYFMQLQAYQMLLDYHENLNQEEVKEVAQPELPLLKNNDQRKEWLQNYRSWGLWYEDKNIGCRYYKYDFKCGAKLIVSEYDNHSPHAYSSVNAYFHLVGGPKPPRGKYGETKWVHHDEYIPGSDNITCLAEFLKEIQKHGEK